MIDLPDLQPPKFQWGQPVVAAIDLYNDGSVADVPEDALLVAAGGPGEVVNIGHHEEANVPVFLVDFGVAVLGCLEDELAAMPVDALRTAAEPVA